MEKFTTLHGLVAPLDRANIDTDAIIPKQFMKSIKRTGFGPNLFDEWRYLDRGEPGQDISSRRLNPAFPLNQSRYAASKILLTRGNFGSGSSREHAVWALYDYGIRAIVAPSFADIFSANCFKNAILPVVLDAGVVDRLFGLVDETPGVRFHIDLPAQTVTPDVGSPHSFDIDASRKLTLLEGIDDISATLMRAERIKAYEATRRVREPWLFRTSDAISEAL